jgi:polysaccharide export outer membrane protein
MFKLAGRRSGILLVAALLNGCAYAPGMYVGNTNTSKANVGIGAWFGSQPDTTADAPPVGRVITITNTLIRNQRTTQPTDLGTDVKKLFDLAKPYTIGPNDVLNIVVWDHPELSVPAAGGLGTDAGSLSSIGNGFNVSPQGLIQFPYAGTLKLAGLTEYEARDLLTARLTKYIKDPQVTLRIQAYRSGRIYIDGEVRLPGLQSLNDVPMTLPEAIARSGGMTALADRSAIAITRDGSTTVVNLPQLLQRNINPNNIMLRNGDLVQVLGREEAKVFVMGEVTRPNTLTLRNGRLTLNEALGEAGGVSQISGDPRQIFVVRAANTEQPEIYHLDASSPTAFALAEGFELKARDVIYVDPVPLVRWNRVISLILPSAAAVTTTRSAIN